jgi:hypothetical protein
MQVHCEKCGRWYDDAARWTICPHNNLAVAWNTPYCEKCDLYNCPNCTDSQQDALCIVKKKEPAPGIEPGSEVYKTTALSS